MGGSERECSIQGSGHLRGHREVGYEDQEMVAILKGEDRAGGRANDQPQHIMDSIGRKMLSSKDYIFWTRFKGGVLCQGWIYWAGILPQRNYHK